MAIAAGNSSTGDVHNPGASTNVTLPSGASGSSIVILSVTVDRGSGTPGTCSAPSGWTSITTFKSVATSNSIATYGFWALGNVANLSLTLTGSTLDVGWVCKNFTGVDTTTPIDATGTTSSATGANNVSANAVTVATDQAWHCICSGAWLGTATTATSFTALENAGANAEACLLYNTSPKSVGSTGAVTVNNSQSATGQLLTAMPFALRPSSSVRISNCMPCL